MCRLSPRLAAPLLAMLLAAPLASSAATLTCTGTIDQVRMHADGSVQVLPSWRGDWINLCNVYSSWKGVPNTVCPRLHTAALTAQTTQGITTTYYASSAAAACNAMALGTNADAPTYFTNQ
jgi:hypothetical protein